MADDISLEERLRSLILKYDLNKDESIPLPYNHDEEKVLLICSSKETYTVINNLTTRLTSINNLIGKPFFYSNRLYHLQTKILDYNNHKIEVYDTFKDKLVSELKYKHPREVCIHNNKAYLLCQDNHGYNVIVDIFSDEAIYKMHSINNLFVWNSRLCYNRDNVVYDSFSNDRILLLKKNTHSLRLLSDNTGNFVLFRDKYNTYLHKILDRLPNPHEISHTKKIKSFYSNFWILHQSNKALYYGIPKIPKSIKIYNLYDSNLKITGKQKECHKFDFCLVNATLVPKKFIKGKL